MTLLVEMVRGFLLMSKPIEIPITEEIKYPNFHPLPLFNHLFSPAPNSSSLERKWSSLWYATMITSLGCYHVFSLSSLLSPISTVYAWWPEYLLMTICRDFAFIFFWWPRTCSSFLMYDMSAAHPGQLCGTHIYLFSFALWNFLKDRVVFLKIERSVTWT